MEEIKQTSSLPLNYVWLAIKIECCIFTTVINKINNSL
jgi:hypothetical protein